MKHLNSPLSNTRLHRIIVTVQCTTLQVPLETRELEQQGKRNEMFKQCDNINHIMGYLLARQEMRQT